LRRGPTGWWIRTDFRKATTLSRFPILIAAVDRLTNGGGDGRGSILDAAVVGALVLHPAEETDDVSRLDGIGAKRA
jgi:hypothetical protein